LTAVDQNSGVKDLPFKNQFIIKMAAVVIIINSITLYVNLLFSQNSADSLLKDKARVLNLT
jgi:hypothetical protein